ncbi:hypothetical protein HO173_002299 [Letharia columbiana]|uniref:Dynein light intermediate chain n=1 Tax=Letharia columbiana TaxID=112416 RepID=A0A8H6L8L8_9LECA|nr:uncharacterized protein HO173_002299 [Letharia columbiana]KAF6239753.1 hypothetical protein HO173_002299 [Letharia columbiana]
MSRQSNFRDPVPTSKSRNDRPQSSGESEKGMWSSMLDSVARGKKLPEKDLVVLGGTPDTQKELLEILSSDAPKRPQDRHKRKPVIANEFALGYTYQDVLDADQEDILARLSIYFLPESSPTFAPLLKPLFTPQSIPETLLIILLDWSEPWRWVRQIKNWITMIRDITSSLGDAPTESMERTMKEWQQRKRGISAYDTGSTGNEGSVTLPLSQGEWDEPLGLPLCVVCHGADKVDALEVEHGWKEEEFDFVLQFLRTILMKHGASLIYTSTSSPNSLPTLIHSTLGIHSQLKKQTLKHNVIDRDKILVPPKWDSWGKIRVLREGFDVEGTSSGWSIDIEASVSTAANGDTETNDAEPDSSTSPKGAVLPTYESTIPNPHAYSSSQLSKPGIETSTPTNQAFLTTQLEILEKLKAEEEAAAASSERDPNSSTFSNATNKPHDERVNEHIGPVQVNMGGIQVDADDMLKKLRSRKEGAEGDSRTPEANTEKANKSPDDMKRENEALNSFFAGLMKRGASGTPRGTPAKRDASRDSSGTPSKKAAARD